MGDLAIDTAVTGGEGTYSAFVNPDWEIWGPMGGYVAAIALRAAAEEVSGAEVGSALVPASFTCQFLSPAAFEEIEVAVQVRRASRRTAAVSVELAQGDRAVLSAQAWFAAEMALVEHDHATHHGRRSYETYPTIQELTDEESAYRFWLNFDGRPTDWIDDWDGYAGGAPEWAEWLRFLPTSCFDDPVLEACRLVLLADLPSFPAASRAHPATSSGSWVSPSLDLAVQFHRLDRLGEWLLCLGLAPIAHRGLIAFRSEIWTADDRLAASGSGQLLTRAVPG
ncbi:MAG TPA: thioesterase family protein [Microthrixaceae bacterium]|nr:thioesterase family protein [Microthrixaceae bacterium]